MVPNDSLAQVVSCSIDKRVFLWDIDLCEDIFEFGKLSAPISGIQFHKNKVIMTSKDGTFRLFSLDDGTLLKIFITPKNNLSFLIQLVLEINSTDKEVILMGSGDEEILIYILDDLLE